MTLVEQEKLIYSLTSLVSYLDGFNLFDHYFQVGEFGGILGLFLGFSFMTLWDGVYYLYTAFKTADMFCTTVCNTK